MIVPGTRIGRRYQVLGYVASGGMQDVYKAFDDLTGQEVALKTPQKGQVHKRFKQSAILSAQVNHFNVAKTTDYLEENGEPFLVEELVEGGTLEDTTLKLAPYVDPHLGAHVLLRLAKGLMASHNVGVAHRDLKPSNVLVKGGINFEEVKITDFGIATMADDLLLDELLNKGGDITRSTSGTIQGALPYMAPEMMFRKKGDPVGLEADIWALGAMTFRLLTGQYPFGEAMYVPLNVGQRKREPWPAFMTANVEFAQLAKSLQDIVEKCLTYDKKARPTARDIVRLAEDLCFFFSPRQSGDVFLLDGSTGRINSAGTTIFYHSNSVYGHAPKKGGKVVFSYHPGAPHPRAHPVLALV